MSDAVSTEEMNDIEATIREKILHVLGVYPRISPSMLQVGMGTSLAPTIWRPILKKMIEEKIIIEENKSVRAPSDRMQSYTILTLAA